MKLTLIRHGQSEDNASNVHNLADVHLSYLGHEQAKALAATYKDYPTDILISSDLIRAQETARYLARSMQKEVVVSNILQEIRRPSDIMGKSYDDAFVKEVKRKMYDNAGDPHWHFSDEENFFEFELRCKKALEYFESLGKEHITAITHGYTIRMLVTVATMENFVKPNFTEGIRYFWDLNNTGVTILTKKGEHWHLSSWNNISHLQTVDVGISS